MLCEINLRHFIDLQEEKKKKRYGPNREPRIRKMYVQYKFHVKEEYKDGILWLRGR